MSTVTFSNGKSVSFAGTPTPQDIDYVAQQMGITPEPTQSLGSEIVNGGKAVANALLSPVESLGVHLGQGASMLTAKGASALGFQGEADKINSRLAQPQTNLTGGTVSTLKPGLASIPQLAGDVVSTGAMLAAPESVGIKTMAGLGALSGVGQSLAQGNTDLGQLGQDTAVGGIFGGVLGAGASSLAHGSQLLKGLTGVTPQVENELKTASSDLVNNYADTAIDHESDIRTPTAHGVAEQAAQDRASILLHKVIPDAGQAVSDAKTAAGESPVMLTPKGVPPIAGSNVANSILNQVSQKVEALGHRFSTIGPDELSFSQHSTPAITPIKGRSVNLDDSDKELLLNLQGQLQVLARKPTVQTASDIITNLDKEIGNAWNKNALTTDTPVTSILKQARGMINSSIGPSSPELAAAKANYSSLMDLKDQLAHEAGSDLQSASLMMRRVLSGDKSKDVVGLLDNLSRITQPYISPTASDAEKTNLVTHAVLADWATKNFGGASAKTLMNQYTSEGSSLLGYASRIANTVMKETVKGLTPEARQYALSISKGSPESLNFVTRLAQTAMNSTEAIPLIGKVTEALNSHGINPNTAVPIVEKLIKTALLNKLSSPSPAKAKTQ